MGKPVVGEVVVLAGAHLDVAPVLAARNDEAKADALEHQRYVRRLVSGDDLASAPLEADAHGEAEQRLAEIAHAHNVADGHAIFDLAHPDSDAASNRYWRLVDTDDSMPIAIRPPSAEDAARVRGLIEEAFALLDAGHRALAGL